MLATVLLAGGLGTRVADLTGDVLPKAMLPVAGRPFIDWKLADLAAQGVPDVYLLVAHRAGLLRAHVGDGRAYGTRVHVIEEGDALLGTGGALRHALPALPDAFFVSYADTYLPVELAPIEAEYRRRDAVGLMTVLENADRWEPSNVEVVDGLVTAYRKGAPAGTFRHLDYGLLVLGADALAPYEDGSVFDLATVFEALAGSGDLVAYEVEERFHDIGTAAALHETERAFGDLGLAGRLRAHLPPGEAP